MIELLRSNDAVLLSFAAHVLAEAGITVHMADQHISIMEGSIGAFPRRLLVDAASVEMARGALTDAGLEQHLSEPSP